MIENHAQRKFTAGWFVKPPMTPRPGACSPGPGPAPAASGNTGKMTWAIENPEPYYNFMKVICTHSLGWPGESGLKFL